MNGFKPGGPPKPPAPPTPTEAARALDSGDGTSRKRKGYASTILTSGAAPSQPTAGAKTVLGA